MQKILTVIQIASSIILIITILLQQRGAGLSATFGGEGNVYRTKRGIEKILFITTIVFSAIFLVSIFLSLIIK